MYILMKRDMSARLFLLFQIISYKLTTCQLLYLTNIYKPREILLTINCWKEIVCANCTNDKIETKFVHVIKLYFRDHLKRANMWISCNIGTSAKISHGDFWIFFYSLFACFHTTDKLKVPKQLSYNFFFIELS